MSSSDRRRATAAPIPFAAPVTTIHIASPRIIFRKTIAHYHGSMQLLDTGMTVGDLVSLKAPIKLTVFCVCGRMSRRLSGLRNRVIATVAMRNCLAQIAFCFRRANLDDTS